jgi:hypothetical protein
MPAEDKRKFRAAFKTSPSTGKGAGCIGVRVPGTSIDELAAILRQAA